MRNQAEPWNFAAIKAPISQEALDQLFCEARTHSTWLPGQTSSSARQCRQNHGTPVTVIIAWSREFHEHLPRLFSTCRHPLLLRRK